MLLAELMMPPAAPSNTGVHPAGATRAEVEAVPRVQTKMNETSPSVFDGTATDSDAIAVVPELLADPGKTSMAN